MEKYIPGESYKITPEGQEAAIEVLSEQAKREQQIAFVGSFLEQFPHSRVALVGGIVRDALLGIKSKDFDLVVEGVDLPDLACFLTGTAEVKSTKAKPGETEADKGETTDEPTRVIPGQPVILSDGREIWGTLKLAQSANYGVLKFAPFGFEGQVPIDIALPRTEVADVDGRASSTQVKTEGITIEDDFSRRDYTINAMGLDLRTGKIIDPFGGQEDIRNRKIRAVGDPRQRYYEDPTRIFRGIRFSTRTGFAIEPTTWAGMQSMVDEVTRLVKDPESGDEIPRVSVEMVKSEFSKALEGDAAQTLELYDQLGLLETFFPEVTALKNIPQPPEFHSEGNAYVHTKLVVSNLPPEVGLNVRLAAVLHDIGKIGTYKSAEETGDRIRFNGHAEQSAFDADTVLRRLRFENRVREPVLWLVENHMKILTEFPHMRRSKQKEIARNPNFLDLVALAIADARSSLRPDGSVDLAFTESIKDVLVELAEGEKEGRPTMILTGKELMPILREVLGQFKPGPIVGDILRRVNDEYHDGLLRDKSEALSRARVLANELLTHQDE